MSVKLPSDTNKWLEPEIMILLYANGAFPMADEDDNINWYQPKIRTIIPLNNFNIPKSFRKFISGTDFEYKVNFDTMKIVKACAKRKETWISEKLIKAYTGLNENGHLKSIGVYRNDKLVGGLYGVVHKGAFFGESMFSVVPQASKFALVKLIEHLNEKKFVLLDVQYMTEHLKMFGAVEIEWEEFEELLSKSFSRNVIF